jgi:predicted  nucleic acid-binding Zn-ribbon protein
MCKTQEFISKLEKVNPDYKNHYEVLNACEKDNKYVFTKTKYGICKSLKANLLKGFNSSIAAAVNPTEYCINKFKKKHGNLYDYFLVDYKGSFKKVKISCKIHGIFEQTPSNHLIGQGCSKCGDRRTVDLQKSNTEEFIIKSELIHKNTYNYSLVDYKTTKIKVKLICNIHGIFEQSTHNHLKGQGCPKCGRQKAVINNQNNPPSWSYTNWGKAGNKSKSFDSFKCYIIQCQDSNKELFYKIGKTFMTMEERFNCKHTLPYNYLEIKVIEGDARTISELETELQAKHKQYKYLPKKKFGGMYECFSQIDLSLI